MTKRSGTLDPSGDYYLYQQIDSALTEHSAWTLDDSIVSGTETTYVWKCLGTANSFGSDFYVAITAATNSGDADEYTEFRIAEDYDSVTGYVTNWAFPELNNAQPQVQADGTWDYSTYLSADRTWTDSQVGVKSLRMSTLNSEYYVSVTENRIVVTSSYNTGDGFMYAGLYESFVHPSRDSMVFPIVIANAMGGAANLGAGGCLTRWPSPAAVGQTYEDFFHSTEPGYNKSFWNYYPVYSGSGTYGNASYDDFMYGALPCRAALLNPTPSLTQWGYFLGLYYDVLQFLGDSNGIDVLDTFSFNSEIYDVVSVPHSSSSNAILLLKSTL